MSETVDRVKAAIAKIVAPAIDLRAPYAKVMIEEAARAAVEAMQPAQTSTEMEDRVGEAIARDQGWSPGTNATMVARAAIAAMQSKNYGIAIFRNKEGQRVVYHLQLFGACDLETDVDNFRPCEFIEITVEAHDGSGNLFRYVAGTDAIEMRITLDPKTGADITTEEP